MKNNFDMKKWKDGLFFLPALIIGIGVLAGFFGNTPSFPKLPVIKAANGTKKSTGLVAQILEKQSANGLSAVSGATCSSKTIRELYLLALTEATGVESHADSDDMATPEPTVAPTVEPAPTVAPEVLKPPSGTYQDGVYPVSTIVYLDEDEDFYEYELSADAVSGATCSSDAWRELYRQAEKSAR